jgi:hypothetical protein
MALLKKAMTEQHAFLESKTSPVLEEPCAVLSDDFLYQGFHSDDWV